MKGIRNAGFMSVLLSRTWNQGPATGRPETSQRAEGVSTAKLCRPRRTPDGGDRPDSDHRGAADRGRSAHIEHRLLRVSPGLDAQSRAAQVMDSALAPFL